MKLKELGPRGGPVSLAPRLHPPMQTHRGRVEVRYVYATEKTLFSTKHIHHYGQTLISDRTP